MRTKLIGAALGTALLLGSAGAAAADTLYNDIDGTDPAVAGVVDAAFETMTLTYDSVAGTGTSGTTNLRLRVDGPALGDRGGCNTQGANQFVTFTAASSNTAAVEVVGDVDFTFSGGCDQVLPVTVKAVGPGSSTISFTRTASESSADPSSPVWSTAEATFVVNVSETGAPVGCDVDPAAPAWAAAILQKSGIKPGDKKTTNLISQIAGELQKQADFQGIQKSAHPAYENAVQARLQIITGKSLASASSAARPGWTCVTP